MGALRIYDISTPIFEGMAGFPGDPPVRVTTAQSLDRGDAYNVSALSLSSHTGTHIDPPVHFLPGAATLDQLDLAVLNGPCQVVEAGPDVRSLGAAAFDGLPTETRRVLFRTANSTRWAESETFFPDYVALGLDGADAAIDRHVRLVGIDSISIERDGTNRFPVHHRLLAASVVILEGLRLAEVPSGRYELQCLPLRLVQGNGGPARAILTTE